MRTIYIDSDFKCHVTDDGTRKTVETDFFDGKCEQFVEGYCYNDSKGYPQIYPWKSSRELEAAQREYERELITNSIAMADLEAAYKEGVNSAYD